MLAGLVVVSGAAIQGAVGFGFGLYAIPLLLWAGLPLQSAIATSLTATIVQTAYNCYAHREHLDFAATLPHFIPRLITMPLGVWAIAPLVGGGQALVKQVVGGFVLLALVVQWALKVKPRERLWWGWAPIAGSLSGFVGGLVGMGGPPLVIWTMAHDWPAVRARAFLWLNILEMSPLVLALLLLRYPGDTWAGAAVGGAMCPLAILGGALGARAGAKLSRHRLRTAAFALLLVIAISAIVEPWA